MERPDLQTRALGRARRAYETSHVIAALKAIAVASLVALGGAALHHTTSTSWLFAIALAGTLGALAYRGGAWRRGAFAGVVAGLPPLIVPSLVIALSSTNHCSSCTGDPTWFCALACFGSSSIVGALVGHRAILDRAPSRFATAAVVTATLTGLLGCGTIGLGGAVGVVVGLVAGAITGWVAAGRPAQV